MTGVQVAWEAAPVAPFTNIATGVRLYCTDIATCPIADGPGTTAPVASPSPTPQPPPPPAAAAAPPPAPELSVGTWLDWVGKPGPTDTFLNAGICPCGSAISVRCVGRAGGACGKLALCAKMRIHFPPLLIL